MRRRDYFVSEDVASMLRIETESKDVVRIGVFVANTRIFSQEKRRKTTVQSYFKPGIAASIGGG